MSGKLQHISENWNNMKMSRSKSGAYDLIGKDGRFSNSVVEMDAIIRMTKLLKRPVVFNEWVMKSFERPDAFNKRVTKSFERVTK